MHLMKMKRKKITQGKKILLICSFGSKNVAGGAIFEFRITRIFFRLPLERIVLDCYFVDLRRV